MKTYNIVIPDGEDKQIVASGSMFKMMTATGALIARADNPEKSSVLCDRLEVVSGDKVGFKADFERLTFKNESGAEVTAKIVIGSGDHVSMILTEQSVRTQAPGGLHSPSNEIIPGSDSFILETFSLGDVESVTVQARSDNPGPVLIMDDAAMGSYKGLSLEPGASIQLKTTANIGIYNDNGSEDCEVSFLVTFYEN